MLEEIGTNKASLLAESKGWLHYDLPIDLVPRIWKGRFRGQRQKWFAFRFDGLDSDINLDTETPEFSAWRWVPFDTVPDLIVPFKRRIYQDVLAEFRDLSPR
jgi:putative (di)nucleoside polyphosphate hydrolase